MSKVFQIESNVCYWDATRQFPTVDSTVGCFPDSLIFVEAPDYVFEGWGYIDGEFIKPSPPEGWIYDEKTGTFYKENMPIDVEDGAFQSMFIDTINMI